MQLLSWDRFKVEIRRRRYQRTLSLRVPSPGRLRVSCSQHLSLQQIFSFIQEKSDFIESCEKELKKVYGQSLVKGFSLGEKCLFLGTERELIPQLTSGREGVELKGDQLLLRAKSLEPESVQKVLLKFYQKTGRNYLSHLVKLQSEKMGLFPTALSFRNQRTRWGSCSSQGKVSLNWRLVAAPSEVAEYVVIHELAHLRHQNHSSNFWSLVESFCPDYKTHKKWLRDHQIQFEFLDPKYVQLHL